MTSIHFHGQFGRICVEIDLTKKLMPHITLQGIKLNLVYERMHAIYFIYGSYGYKCDSCVEFGVLENEGIGHRGNGTRSEVNGTSKEGQLLNPKADVEMTHYGDDGEKSANVLEVVKNAGNQEDLFGLWMIMAKPMRNVGPRHMSNLHTMIWWLRTR